jgi:hypothetical protein
VSHKKLSELGQPHLKVSHIADELLGATASPSTVLAQAGVGVVVTGIVIVASYLYEAKRKLKAS